MLRRLSSESRRGLFVSVDGPSGAGKSTIVRHLAQQLVAEGYDIHLTAEPSDGPMGRLAHDVTEHITGYALACLYAADRYHHVETEIQPRLHEGRIVISDRYVPSGLVLQRFDGVELPFLMGLNADVDRPDLAVILEADPDTIAERLHARGTHNRFQRTPQSSQVESVFYHEAAEQLETAGFAIFRVDCTTRPPEQTAARIRGRLAEVSQGTELP